MRIDIKTLTNQDLNDVVALNIKQYGNTLFTNNEWYRWRFFSKTIPGVMLGAYHGNRLIGTTGLTIAPYKCNDEIRMVGLTESSLIDPEFRYNLVRNSDSIKTIFQLLIERMHETAVILKCDAIIGFPNSNSFPVFIDQFAYEHYGYFDFALMPLNLSVLEEFSDKFFLKFISPLFPIFEKVYQVIKISRNESTELCKNIIPLFGKDSPQALFTLKRTDVYMQWRVVSNPLMYEYCSSYINGKLTGYCCWKTSIMCNYENGRKIKATRIVDLWVDEATASQKTVSGLLNAVLNSAIETGSALIFTSIKTCKDRQNWFSKNGYIWMKKRFFSKKIPIIIKKFNQFELPSISHWHLCMIDNDII